MSEENQEVAVGTEKSVGTDTAQGQEVLKGLTIPVQRFAENYAVYGNALKSSRLAGIHEDYGGHLLERGDVRRAIEHFRAVYADNSTYNPPKLVRQWSQQASFQPAQLLNNDWSVRNLDELPSDLREHFNEALLGFEVIEKSGSRTIKPKFGKQLAQEQLGKLMKLYQEDKAQGQQFSLNITLGGPTQSVESTAETIGHINITAEELS